MDYMCSAEKARISAAEEGQQKEGKNMYSAKLEDCKEVKQNGQTNPKVGVRCEDRNEGEEEYNKRMKVRHRNGLREELEGSKTRTD